MNKLDLTETERQIQELCERVGCKRAEVILRHASDNVFGPKSSFQRKMEEFKAHVRRAYSAVLSGLGSGAGKANQKEIQLVLNVLNAVGKGFNVIQATDTAVNCVSDWEKQLKSEIAR